MKPTWVGLGGIFFPNPIVRLSWILCLFFFKWVREFRFELFIVQYPLRFVWEEGKEGFYSWRHGDPTKNPQININRVLDKWSGTLSGHERISIKWEVIIPEESGAPASSRCSTTGPLSPGTRSTSPSSCGPSSPPALCWEWRRKNGQ